MRCSSCSAATGSSRGSRNTCKETDIASFARRAALAAAAALCACSDVVPPAGHPALQALPRVGVWAWERPERIEFPSPRPLFVAYVEHQIWISADEVRHRPRLQPLAIGDAVAVPVVHVEPSSSKPPALTEAQAEAIVRWTVAAGRASPSRVVQLDFEARASQREFYRKVVREVRRLLPPEIALSVTALASLCAGDPWLRGLPADEVVPMLFRMGRDSQEIARIWQRERQLPELQCRSSVGLSTDEMQPAPRAAATRIYLFHPGRWSTRVFDEAIGRLGI